MHTADAVLQGQLTTDLPRPFLQLEGGEREQPDVCFG
jgi:hypothetical protein